MRIIRRIPFLFGAAYIAMAAVFLLRFNHLPPQIPLYYSLPLPGNQVVSIWYIALLPLFLSLFLAINVWGVSRLLKDDDFSKTLLYSINCIVIVASTYLFIRIILLIS